jgi:predicted 3-demethylubiquinone-9 3-methyltransferase (glyoxalase superfamily)
MSEHFSYEDGMPIKMQRVTPYFWFDDNAEEAVKFYTSIFPNSSIGKTTRYDAASAKVSGRPEGSVMTIDFTLDGQNYGALNGGPLFKFSEALSLMIHCETQAEVDHFWERLGAGGDPQAQQCGWLKDRYGVSWQVVPVELDALLADPARGHQVTAAMLQMKKLDLAALRRVAAGA